MPDNHTKIHHLLGDQQQTAQQPAPSQQQTQQPASYGGPEKEPHKSLFEILPDDLEIRQPVEHEPDAEVEGYIQDHKDTIKVSSDLQNLGVQSTGQSKFTNQEILKLPISDERIATGLKSPITSSLRWLSEFCIYLLRKSHIVLKLVHGKIVRTVNTSSENS